MSQSYFHSGQFSNEDIRMAAVNYAITQKPGSLHIFNAVEEAPEEELGWIRRVWARFTSLRDILSGRANITG